VLNKIALALGSTAILVYAVVAFTGTEFGDPEREVVPADVRQSPGGYRSFHFWHSGYQGGK
jgi:hypothetical protein